VEACCTLRGWRRVGDARGAQAEDQAKASWRTENWARLIQKIYEVAPLTCPKCQGRMKISFIEDEEVIEKILKHLGCGR